MHISSNYYPSRWVSFAERRDPILATIDGQGLIDKYVLFMFLFTFRFELKPRTADP